MTVTTLRVGSLSAERWSGVTRNKLSEQCGVSAKPVNLGAASWEESYAVSGFDYVNVTGVVGEIEYPEVDHTTSNGVFLISPDQTNGILHAIARVHKDATTLDSVEITVPYTIDDDLAEVRSVKVHDAGVDNPTARMDNMVSPHQISPGFTMPTEVCSPFTSATELTDVTVAIPEPGTSEPALSIDISEYLKNTSSINLAIGLYLEVEVVDPNGDTPTSDTKVVFDGTQAEILFRHTETPKVLEVLEVSTQQYRANMAFGSHGAVLFADSVNSQITTGVSYSAAAAAGSLVTPPFFKREHSDSGLSATTALSVTVEYPKAGGKAPSAYFSGDFAGSTTVGYSQVSVALTPTDPEVTMSGTDGLTIVDYVDPAYDPDSPAVTYTINIHKLYSATGIPKGVHVGGVSEVDIDYSTAVDDYGTTGVTVIFT